MTGRRMHKPIVVIDTDVLVSTAAQHNLTRIPFLWACVRVGHVLAVTCQSALDELNDVASRPQVLASLPQLAARFPIFLREYLQFASVIQEPTERFILQSDPKDSKFFNLAIAAQAFAIVSFDKKHVLPMADPAHPQHHDLKTMAPHLLVLHPGQFGIELRRLLQGRQSE